MDGRLHLVWGNHDGEETRRSPLWVSSQPFAEITVEERRLVLCQYALKVWNGERRGAVQLFGHSHGRLPGDRQSCDVGVDYPAWACCPVRFRDIEQHLTTLPDHESAERIGEAD